ncbi:MAG: helix-turn-helix domain-containing protein [Acidimicrobiales bacterium]
MARKRSGEHRMVLRAKIVLAAAGGTENASIATSLGLALNTIIKWRKRYFEEGLDGLKDRDRSGRPKSFGFGSLRGTGQAARGMASLA